MNHSHLIRSQTRQGMSLYVVVVCMSLIVSLLGLSGLMLVRIERQQSSNVGERIIARNNARSAVELALRVIANDSDWRTTFTSGVETSALSLGDSSAGTVSWILTDSDGDLTDADTELRLSGIGRVDSTIQASSVEVESIAGPEQELRSYADESGAVQDELVDNKWWGQYLTITLPADAIAWKVTSIELFCDKDKGNRDFTLNIYEPQADMLPSANLIDSVDLNSDDFSNGMSWQTITLSGDYQLNPGDDICFTIETTENQEPINLEYQSSGVSETGSAMLIGTPTWGAAEPIQSLLYKVHGVYWTADGAVQAIPQSWRWDAAP